MHSPNEKSHKTASHLDQNHIQMILSFSKQRALPLLLCEDVRFDIHLSTLHSFPDFLRFLSNIHPDKSTFPWYHLVYFLHFIIFSLHWSTTSFLYSVHFLQLLSSFSFSSESECHSWALYWLWKSWLAPAIGGIHRQPCLLDQFWDEHLEQHH